MPTTQTGPNTTADDATVGSFAWNRTNSDLVADDGTESSVQLASSNISHYLFCTNFGFAVPTGATIVGLEVQILRRVDNVGVTYPDITDYSIRLIRVGALITGDDKADVAVWGTAESWAYYGDDSDLWGATLTPAIVNDTTFGVAVSLDATGGITSAIAYIDQLIITITYTEPAPDENQATWYLVHPRRALPLRRARSLILGPLTDEPPTATDIEYVAIVSAQRRNAGTRSRFVTSSPTVSSIFQDPALTEDWWLPQFVAAARPRGLRPARPHCQIVQTDLFAGQGVCECEPGGAVIVGPGYAAVVVSLTDASVGETGAVIVRQGYGLAVIVSQCDC